MKKDQPVDAQLRNDNVCTNCDLRLPAAVLTEGCSLHPITVEGMIALVPSPVISV